ncbi:hypothetical protein HanPI659440_Chr09g0346401 [Helianthus annuus]|nr:hypothetical protein HanPI659440_Chr09g0346401 [Helianthus annuus]
MSPKVLRPATMTPMTTWDLRSVNLDKMFAPKLIRMAKTYLKKKLFVGYVWLNDVKVEKP